MTKTIMKISSRNLPPVGRRRLVKGGMAGIIATGLAPTFARAEAKKLVMAHIVPPPESGAVGFAWQAEEVRKRSNGELDMQFFGGTLLSKELEIMNAVKSGNIQMGDPAGAAATVFPEMGVFLVPYLVQSYAHAYKMFNGAIGDALDKQFQDKYKLKVMCFFDYGFRHFWTAKKPIIEPKDLRGAKIRVQQAKVFGDTINGLGGNAVPMAWGEVISAAKSGVIDGGDLPIVNQIALKIYEVSKYCSMSFHNYGPTLNTMNLGDLGEPQPRAQEADDRHQPRGAAEDPAPHRIGRQFRRRQERARAQGHDRGRGQGRGLPQGGDREDLAGLQVSSTAACGSRSRASRRKAGGATLHRVDPQDRRFAPAGRRHRQPADRRVPALRHDPGDGLARHRLHPVHLGRGSGRDAARLAHPDRRGDRRARAHPLHPARPRISRRGARFWSTASITC